MPEGRLGRADLRGGAEDRDASGARRNHGTFWISNVHVHASALMSRSAGSCITSKSWPVLRNVAVPGSVVRDQPWSAVNDPTGAGHPLHHAADVSHISHEDRR
jgi:hypothetical protein